MIKVLLTGANGQLGSEIKLCLSSKYLFYAFNRDELDITQKDQLLVKVKALDPDVIINCAAFTDVEAAEEEYEIANAINHIGAQNIAIAADIIGAKLIHLSSDYVFGGEKSTPYDESDQINPINAYGKTKFLGEEAIQMCCKKYFILRTSWLYGRYGNNFVTTMLNLSSKVDTIKVVNDQIGVPTCTIQVIEVIDQMITSEAYGIYHVTAAGECSWYTFAKTIFDIKNVQIKVLPVKSEYFNFKAQRPLYSRLSTRKVEETFGIKTVKWYKILKQYLDKY